MKLECPFLLQNTTVMLLLFYLRLVTLYFVAKIGALSGSLLYIVHEFEPLFFVHLLLRTLL